MTATRMKVLGAALVVLVFGVSAGYAMANGIGNVSLGQDALQQDETGVGNVAVGDYTLNTNTTGDYNTATGYAALRHNTTGDYNVAGGTDSLYANTSGSFNTAINYDALHKNADGWMNVALGPLALYENTGGDENVAVGFAAGLTSEADGNVFVGHQADVETGALQNVVAIGHQAKATKSNQVVLGNDATTETVLRGEVVLAGGVRLTVETAPDGRQEVYVVFPAGGRVLMASEPEVVAR